ncbi:MAG: protein translocase subunit SecF [Candidatus Doudnabacteria bacterium]|nr:protein translocase subunit SecF [Candidatus Doudnabacteria bacterium]
MLNIIKNYKFWFVVSGIIMLIGIISLITFGLKTGIDFSGGTLSQIKFEKALPAQEAVGAELSSAGFEATLQSASEKSVIIRTPPMEKERHDQLVKILNDKFGPVTEEQFTSIGPVIGKELRRNAAWQLLLVSLGIVLYIAYAFRKVSKPVSSWKFGISAIAALLHDLLIVVGVFSLLGKFFDVQIDSLFVTALLTVLGFSVHDTIVVFDRIRENLKTRGGYDLGQVINDSVNQTLVRSINTSLTVIFVLLALLLFGGETIRYFVLALLIGIGAGTYSSIFIASPLLYVWHRWDLRRRA